YHRIPRFIDRKPTGSCRCRILDRKPCDPEHLSMPRSSIVTNDGSLRQALGCQNASWDHNWAAMRYSAKTGDFASEPILSDVTGTAQLRYFDIHRFLGRPPFFPHCESFFLCLRSEERRVGKDCRMRVS